MEKKGQATAANRALGNQPRPVAGCWQNREQQRQPPPPAPKSSCRQRHGGQRAGGQASLQVPKQGFQRVLGRLSIKRPGIDLDTMCWLQKSPELKELKLRGRCHPLLPCVNCPLVSKSGVMALLVDLPPHFSFLLRFSSFI